VNSLKETLSGFFETVLLIRPGEGRRTALLFLHLLLASSVFILGRTVRDTLFLTFYPVPLSKALPWMFILYGVASALTVVIYSRFADKVARHKLIAISIAIGVATYIGTWVVARSGTATWIYPVFYVWSEVAANLFIVQFWTLANDLHDARSAKRLFGTIGSARILGVVLVGLMTGSIVKAIGTAQLLFVLAGMMACIVAIAFVLAKEPRVEGAGATAQRRGPPPKIIGDPYVRVLALMILLAFTSLTIGDYQFKAIAKAAYAGRADDLARFFSLFYAGVGAISFLFQILVTPRLLARLGVGMGMSVMPFVFGGASALLFFFPKLAVVVPMKFADNGFQYTIHDTTLQALYVPFAPAVKARTRAFLDAVIKPLSYGVGGVVLLVLAPILTVGQLAAVTVPIVGVWFVVIPFVRRRYLSTLQSTLSVRGTLAFDGEYILDSAGRKALIETLEHGSTRQALIALEQLADERSPEFTAAVEKLAAHPDATLRAAALQRLATLPGASVAPVLGALADDDPDVRAAAARAYAALSGDEAVEALAPLLADKERDVRVAAAAGLLAEGGVEGGIVGGAHLGQLLAMGERQGRIEAARVLRSVGHGAFRPLRRLLADPEPQVRRAALKAAASCPDPRLVPLLIQALSDPHCHRQAGNALVAVGEASVSSLCELLESETTPRSLKLLVPRLLRRIPVPATYERLRAVTAVDDAHLRLRVYAALSHLRHALHREGERLPWLEGVVRREIGEAYGNLAAWEQAKVMYDTPLLGELFQFREARAVRRVLRALELRYSPATLRLVRERLADPRRRANAMEVLDTLLDAPLRPIVMPFLDDRPLAERLKKAGSLVPPMPESVEYMKRMSREPNPVLAYAALDALARAKDPAGREEGLRAIGHEDPLVREGGIAAFAAVAEPADVERVLRPLLEDPDPVVAKHAKSAIARAGASTAPEAVMLSTVEKILFLKSAPVFTRLSGEDLAPLARIAELVSFSPAQKIFAEGEMGDALFVIVRGKVEIRRGGHTVATLGTGEAFGEMAVLDEVPRSADAVAADETDVLRIGSEEFYELLHEQVEIAEGVIKMLTHRLREADETIHRIKDASAA
jgi:ATP/ADP translocase/HEAT repeat protein